MGSKNCVLMTCFKISVTGCRIATMKNSSCVTNNKLKNICKKTFKKIFQVHSWSAKIIKITVWSKQKIGYWVTYLNLQAFS